MAELLDRMFQGGCDHLSAWIMAGPAAAAATDEILVECPVCGPLLIGSWEPPPPGATVHPIR